MKTIISITITVIAIFVYSCAQSSKEMANADVATEATPSLEEAKTGNNNGFTSSSAAVEKGKDTTRKFIRTADLKFKVKNVIHSTYDIENITLKNGGFVTYTNLTSHIDYVNTVKTSKDSSLEITHFTMLNNMVIRVPNTLLDTTLREIARNIHFLDYRVIKADDVALQLLSNSLTQKRIAKAENRLTNAIDNRGKKLKETTQAEELLLDKQEQADNAMISNLSLKDKIEYSTITLELYQSQNQKYQPIANAKTIADYEPHLGIKIWDSLQFGWTILEGIFLVIVKLWAVILAVILGFIMYKKYKKTKTKV